MKRGYGLAVGAVLLLAAVILETMHWIRLGFTPALLVLGLIVVVGIPGALLLALGRHTPLRERRMPRSFWIGVGLIAFGLLAVQPWFAVTTRNGPIPLGPIFRSVTSGTASTMRFAPLPEKVRATFAAVFPNLAVGRSLAVTGYRANSYEVWLRRPDSNSFALQAFWSEGTVRIENQALNTDYLRRPGHPMKLPEVERMYTVPKGVLGPFAFPGYVLYVDPALAQTRSVDRISGVLGGGTGY